MTVMAAEEHYDVVVVGAGFAGIYAVHRLQEAARSVRGFEIGADAGGTWYWNRYPGARCDVESLDYSYSFSPELEREWTWTEKYATQPEILRYLQFVADRFHVRRAFQFETRVVAATYDEQRQHWRIDIECDGEREAVTATYCILATGVLSAPSDPHLSGMSTFAGSVYQTSRWPHRSVRFEGQRVGLIGTGSSGIQSMPRIAEEADHVTVFQRSPNFSVPVRNAEVAIPTAEEYAVRRQICWSSRNGQLSEGVPKSALDVDPAERERHYEAAWQRGGVHFNKVFTDLMTSLEANATAADFARRKIRSIVRDPAVAEMLVPLDHPIGTKRICTDLGYYEAFNRDNVTLVDIRKYPIVEVLPSGINTEVSHHDLDVIIFATGFDAMTGSFLRIDVRGRGGRSLRDEWNGGPRTYLGLAVDGFPNLFITTGPGSPSVLTNMALAAEQHVNWIVDCLAHMDAKGLHTIEAEPAAQLAWTEHVNDVGNATLFPRANSWYTGGNIEGKAQVFMPYIGGFADYIATCDDVAGSGYRGFRFG